MDLCRSVRHQHPATCPGPVSPQGLHLGSASTDFSVLLYMGKKDLRTTAALPCKFLLKSHPCGPAAASAWLGSRHHIALPLPDELIVSMLRAALLRSNAHTPLLGWGFLGCLSVLLHCRSSAKVCGSCRLFGHARPSPSTAAVPMQEGRISEQHSPNWKCI